LNLKRLLSPVSLAVACAWFATAIAPATAQQPAAPPQSTAAGKGPPDQPKILSDGAAIIPGAHQFLLRDENSGREYLVRVAEPAKQSPAGTKPPVIYVLDGNWYFGLATDIARMLPIGTSTPPAYVVAIGYADSNFDSVVANREHDLMYGHFADRPEVGGGGAAFQSFLTGELRSFIERRYEVDPDRAYLAGQSLGGQFTAAVLLNDPDAFAGYLIGSPSLWANGDIMPAAQRFTQGAGRRVMIGTGAAESPGMRDGAAALAAALSRPETGLAVSTRFFENQHHMSMQGPWFAEGLRFLMDGATGGIR